MNNNLKSLFATLALAITIASCKKDDATSSTTTTTNPDPIAVTDCASATGIEKIICLVNAFKSQLSSSQIATVQVNYSKSDAIKWSNFPQALVASAYKRVGLNFGSMTTTQIQYAKAIIKELTSSAANEGWDELQQLLNADDYLASINSGGGYGSANYYVAFLGTPATTGTFEIQFGGHHVAFANTYTNGVLAGATPSFRGVEPIATFTYNGVSNQALQQEKAAFVSMLHSLSTSELATAKLSSTVSDLVAGPQKDNNFPGSYSGIKVGNLTAAQKELVMAAIKTYVGDVAGTESFLTTYQSELDNTYISWSGNTSLENRGDYVRIDGPHVWIEWAGQGGIVFSASHPHSVWRDKTRDYGGN